jgi:hypothetical protein
VGHTSAGSEIGQPCATGVEVLEHGVKGGIDVGAMVALVAGATQVLCDFEPAAVLGLIEGERCSVLIGGRPCT